MPIHSRIYSLITYLYTYLLAFSFKLFIYEITTRKGEEPMKNYVIVYCNAILYA